MKQLDQTRWDITLDEFTDTTPFGEKSFTNIIATMDSLKTPTPKRLVLSAHYDSKYDKDNMFVGATDSAVPVAMILDLVLTLDSKLKNRKVSSLYNCNYYLLVLSNIIIIHNNLTLCKT